MGCGASSASDSLDSSPDAWKAPPVPLGHPVLAGVLSAIEQEYDHGVDGACGRWLEHDLPNFHGQLHEDQLDQISDWMHSCEEAVR